MLSSGLGTATGMFKLKKDLRAMLQSEDFCTAVTKRRGSMANMTKPVGQLVDEAIEMGAKIVSMDLN